MAEEHIACKSANGPCGSDVVTYLLENAFSQTEHLYGFSLVSGEYVSLPSPRNLCRVINVRERSCRLKCSVFVNRLPHTAHCLRTMIPALRRWRELLLLRSVVIDE